MSDGDRDMEEETEIEKTDRKTVHGIGRGDTITVDIHQGPQTVVDNTVWGDSREAEVVSVNDDNLVVTIPEVEKNTLFRYPYSAVSLD